MLRNFTFRLFLLTIALYGILRVVFSSILKIYIPSELMLGLLFVLNAGAYQIMARTDKGKPAPFVRNYMLLTIVRLLICGAFIFIYSLTHRENSRPFVITFFLLYLIYVFMEVRAVKKSYK